MLLFRQVGFSTTALHITPKIIANHRVWLFVVLNRAEPCSSTFLIFNILIHYNTHIIRSSPYRLKIRLPKREQRKKAQPTFFVVVLSTEFCYKTSVLFKRPASKYQKTPPFCLYIALVPIVKEEVLVTIFFVVDLLYIRCVLRLRAKCVHTEYEHFSFQS